MVLCDLLAFSLQHIIALLTMAGFANKESASVPLTSKNNPYPSMPSFPSASSVWGTV